MTLNVYLNFQGQAEEAVNFYAKVLNAPEPRVLKYSDLPPNPNFVISDDVKHYVMHTEVNVGDINIKLSDIIPEANLKLSVGNNMSIVLNFDTDEEINEVYNKLAEGAEVIMPLSETMWAKKYAYLVDKFATPWQLSFKGDKVFGR